MPPKLKIHSEDPPQAEDKTVIDAVAKSPAKTIKVRRKRPATEVTGSKQAGSKQAVKKPTAKPYHVVYATLGKLPRVEPYENVAAAVDGVHKELRSSIEEDVRVFVFGPSGQITPTVDQDHERLNWGDDKAPVWLQLPAVPADVETITTAGALLGDQEVVAAPATSTPALSGFDDDGFLLD